MATIDLLHGYVKVDALLEEYGYPDATYSLEVDVWNKRQGVPDVGFRIYALLCKEPHEGIIAVAATLDACLETMRARLIDYQARQDAADLRQVLVPDVESAA